MSRLTVHCTPIAGLKIIKRQPLGDERGFLERLFCYKTLKFFLKEKTIRQINHTLTSKEGTVRGLHFQLSPHAEFKLISCLRDKICGSHRPSQPRRAGTAANSTVKRRTGCAWQTSWTMKETYHEIRDA